MVERTGQEGKASRRERVPPGRMLPALQPINLSQHPSRGERGSVPSFQMWGGGASGTSPNRKLLPPQTSGATAACIAHLTNEETEVEGGKVTCPRSCNWEVVEPGPKPRSLVTLKVLLFPQQHTASLRRGGPPPCLLCVSALPLHSLPAEHTCTSGLAWPQLPCSTGLGSRPG